MNTKNEPIKLDAERLKNFLSDIYVDSVVIENLSKPNQTESPMDQIHFRAIVSSKLMVDLNAHKNARYLALTFWRINYQTKNVEKKNIWRVDDYPTMMDMGFLSQLIKRVDQF